jgi:hypothetical protein
MLVVQRLPTDSGIKDFEFIAATFGQRNIMPAIEQDDAGAWVRGWAAAVKRNRGGYCADFLKGCLKLADS